MYCFWNYSNGVDQYITRYRVSSDGVDWSERHDLYTTNLSTKRLLSPAVAYHGGRWHVWAIDSMVSPRTMFYESASELTGLTSAGQACVIDPPLPPSRDLWHVAVQRFGDEWHAIVMDTTFGMAGTRGELYLMTSVDGLKWRRGRESLAPRVGPYWYAWYRSGFVPAVVNGSAGHEVWAATFGGSASPIVRNISRARIAFDRPQSRAERSTLALSAASRASGEYVLGDTFQRINGALSKAPTGQTWTALTGGSQVDGGVLRGASRSVADTGMADGYVEVTIRQMVNSGDGAVLFRAQDANNYWAFGWVGYWFQLVKVVGGVTTEVRRDAKPLIPDTLSLSDEPVRVGVRMSGPTITLLVNGQQWGEPVTDTALMANTKHGFALWDGGTRLGAVTVRAIEGASPPPVVVPASSAGGAGSSLLSGESTIARELATVDTAATLASGEWIIAYFTASSTRTVTKLRAYTGTTGTTGTPATVQWALFRAGADNTSLTKLGEVPSDTARFANANTAYTGTLASPVNLVVGQRYAVGMMMQHSPSAGTVRPSFVGAKVVTDPNENPVMSRKFWPGGGDPAPATVSAGATSSATEVPYVSILT